MLKKILIALGGVVVALVGTALVFVFVLRPANVPVPEIAVEGTAAQIARGEYLSEHIAGCTGCHADVSHDLVYPRPVAGTQGRGGGLDIGRDKGFPGRIVSPNITPAGIGDWSDGEIVRAVTAGLSKDGTPLFPMMNYPAFSKLAKDDLAAIVAYLRTLPAIEYEAPARELDPPLNVIVRLIPKEPALRETAPQPGDADYAEYVATAADCASCHTPMDDRGQPLASMAYAGGMEFTFADGSVARAANITPDEATGIGSWTREAFIAKFKAFELEPEPVAAAGDDDDSAAGEAAPPPRTGFVSPPVKPGEFRTEMPWTSYGGMTEEDLGAIYDYLMAQPAVDNEVERFSPG